MISLLSTPPAAARKAIRCMLSHCESRMKTGSSPQAAGSRAGRTVTHPSVPSRYRPKKRRNSLRSSARNTTASIKRPSFAAGLLTVCATLPTDIMKLPKKPSRRRMSMVLPTGMCISRISALPTGEGSTHPSPCRMSSTVAFTGLQGRSS